MSLGVSALYPLSSPQSKSRFERSTKLARVTEFAVNRLEWTKKRRQDKIFWGGFGKNTEERSVALEGRSVSDEQREKPAVDSTLKKVEKMVCAFPCKEEVVPPSVPDVGCRSVCKAKINTREPVRFLSLLLIYLLFFGLVPASLSSKASPYVPPPFRSSNTENVIKTFDQTLLSLDEIFPRTPSYVPKSRKILELPRELIDMILSYTEFSYKDIFPRLYLEMLARITHRARSSKVKTYVPREVVPQLARSVFANVPLRSPLLKTPFQTAAEQSRSLGSELERVFARNPDCPQIPLLLEQRQKALDEAFTIFCRVLDLFPRPVPPPGVLLRYSKSDADRALQGAIGDAFNRGNGIFLYPGLRPMDFSDDDEAARAFSVYMARKGFSNVDPRKAIDATAAFYDRVCSAPPPLDPYMTMRQNRLLLLHSRLCSVLFRKGKKGPPAPKAPNTGKACLEVPLSKGGKRAALYLRQLEGDPKKPLRADTILSGGKFRTITVSSVHAQRYSWLNEFLFNRLRKCRWMVAGTTVQDAVTEDSFMAEMEGGLPQGFSFSCGDGKSATDYFDRRFMDQLLEFVAKEFELPLDELQHLCTHAVFENGMVQLRAQLQGSDFSFPGLCLNTFLSHIGKDPSYVESLLDLSDRDLLTWVMDYDTCLVNGDDLVEKVQDDEVHTWVESYPLIGGVPAPEKSPRDAEYFTINSQLWRFPKYPGSRPHSVGAILPAMLLNLLGKSHTAPDVQWANLLSSPLLSPKAINEFRLDLLLLPDVPRSLGGLGIFPPLSPERLLYAFFSRPLDGAILAESFNEEILTVNGSIQVLSETYIERSEERFSGWVPASEIHEEANRRFGSRRALHWKETTNKVHSAGKVRSLVIKHRSQPGIVARGVFIHKKEKEGLRYIRSGDPTRFSQIVERDLPQKLTRRIDDALKSAFLVVDDPVDRTTWEEFPQEFPTREPPRKRKKNCTTTTLSQEIKDAFDVRRPLPEFF